MNETLTAAQIANKVEVAIGRGASPKYPLIISQPANGGETLTLEFEDRLYKLTIEDLGERQGDEDFEGDNED